MARVLVVDDDDGVRSFLQDALELAGHEVSPASSGEAAVLALQKTAFHVILTDLRMSGMDGMALLRAARELSPEAQVIVLTAHGSVDTAVMAMKEGAFDFLQKPVESPAALRRTVDRAVERHRLLSRVEGGGEAEAPVLTWGDPRMGAAATALQKVASTEATVLLLGESGVGKEVAARYLHARSKRAAGPFVAVNCAALSETLLESELFGHEKGAFTGATARKRGKLELADGGTFFLDEVGELKPDLQARLLRVLQERRFERVGGVQTVSADVRWVAATNRDLKALAREGRFREDLYYRLAVFPIQLPPLRDRPGDLLPLANALLQRIGREMGRPGLHLSEGSIEVVLTHRWPGNARELGNALERAVILSDGPEIDLDPPSGPIPVPPGGTTLDTLERAAVIQALAAEGGHRRRAAERLGIAERTLYDKLKRYGLS